MKPGGLLALMAASLLCGCGRKEGSAEVRVNANGPGEVEAVRAAEEAQLQAYRDRDVPRILAGYAPDATLVMGGQPPLSGAEAIRASLTRTVSDPAFLIRLDTQHVEVGAAGDLAYTSGAYHVTYTDPGTKTPVSEEGRYVTIFRKQSGGDWKAVEDIASPGPRAASGE